LRRRDRLLELSLFVIVPHAAYLIAIGGDHFEFRPLDFYWPLLAVGVADALGGLALWLRLRARRARAWKARATSLLPWSAVVAALVVASTVMQLSQFVAEYPRRSKRDLAPEPAPQVTLATFPAGEVLPGFDVLVRAYQGSMTNLNSHAIAVPWVEHRAFQATLLRQYGPYGRSDREPFPEGAVMAHKWMGIIPYHLPEVTFIDELGLTDKTVARHASPSPAHRMMAHDRSPPPGYLERRGVNVTIKPAARSLDEALLLAPHAVELAPGLWAPFSSPRTDWLTTGPRAPRWYHLDWRKPERSVIQGRRVHSARRLLDCETERETERETGGETQHATQPLGWTLSGARCVRRPGTDEAPIAQAEGKGWLSTYDSRRGDAALADARSPTFSGGADRFLLFKLGGGSSSGVRLTLRDASGRDLATFRGAGDQTLRTVLVDLRPHSDGELHLDVIDAEMGSSGHLLLDAVMLLDLEPLPSEQAISSQRADALPPPGRD
jgi:hypothetical protein